MSIFLPHQKLMPNSRIIIDSIFFSTNHWCPHFTINVDFFLPSIKCWYFYSQHQLLMPNSFFFFLFLYSSITLFHWYLVRYNITFHYLFTLYHTFYFEDIFFESGGSYHNVHWTLHQNILIWRFSYLLHNVFLLL